MNVKPAIYEFRDYRRFLGAWIASSAKEGRGQLARISEVAAIHKTTLSQIFHGSKELSLEQAHRVAQYLGLTDAETEYFVLLVNHERAGSVDLRKLILRQIEARQKSHQQLSNRVSRSRELSSEERSIYYSSWIYSAVRNLTAIDGFQSAAEISKKLGLELSLVNKVVEFLVENGLCVRKSEGLRPGPQMTHLESESPLVVRHHGNWRVKAMERHPVLRAEQELAYTAAMTLSVSDVGKIRALLADLVQKTDEVVGPSASEKLYCLCLDWFEVL